MKMGKAGFVSESPEALVSLDHSQLMLREMVQYLRCVLQWFPCVLLIVTRES